MTMKWIESLHTRWIHQRRVRVLANWIVELIPSQARVLDIGCGDGRLAAFIGSKRSDIEILGVDVLVRPETAIPVVQFDGMHLPQEDRSFDTVLFVDVLHHCNSPVDLVAEAGRVTRNSIIVKDHYLQGWFAKPTLQFMDNVSNRKHGVAVPGNYLTPEQWQRMIESNRFELDRRILKLGLYPPPLSWFFERQLHFIDVWKHDG